MIVVTGAAGFIGSNLVRALNARGITNIIAVDHLKNGKKIHHLSNSLIHDYYDKSEWRALLRHPQPWMSSIQAIFHQGACSTTTEWDGQYMMDNNYRCSVEHLAFCQENRIPLIYASSASVYGSGSVFKEDLLYEKPLNPYAYSKFLFDQKVRTILKTGLSAPLVGLRYFNVYGPGESHKGSMASVAYHWHQKLLSGAEDLTVFEGSHGYGPGEQLRDFVYVDDVVSVNLWFLDHPSYSGIFNVGTGRAASFNAVAQAIIDFHRRGKITYIPFPEHLIGAYQSYTQAEISALVNTGYIRSFRSVQEAIPLYLEQLSYQKES